MGTNEAEQSNNFILPKDIQPIPGDKTKTSNRGQSRAHGKEGTPVLIRKSRFKWVQYDFADYINFFTYVLFRLVDSHTPKLVNRPLSYFEFF